MDPTDCNYDDDQLFEDPEAICIYPDGICETCSGETNGNGTIIDNDAEDDEVCDDDEIVG